jgi:fumarate hydratase subunit alpha
MPIDRKDITDTVAALCRRANTFVSPDIHAAIESARRSDAAGAPALDRILENHAAAAEDGVPLCQDTGMAVVFVDYGQDARVTGGSVADAVNAGVAKGYREGYLRKSVVADPIRRVNTGDNTPAVIHFRVVEGSDITITVAPKGFGSENMSALAMLKPSDGMNGVKDFIVRTVFAAGSNPCPPIIVGAGVGGTMEKAAITAKRQLLRPVGEVHPDAFWAEAEQEILARINAAGVGAAGRGGLTTALSVHIGVFPTHIAGLPVAVNIGCHVTRHETAALKG